MTKSTRTKRRIKRLVQLLIAKGWREQAAESLQSGCQFKFNVRKCQISNIQQCLPPNIAWRTFSNLSTLIKFEKSTIDPCKICETLQKQHSDDWILVVPYSHSRFLLQNTDPPQRLVPVGRCRLPLGPRDGATYITVTALLLLSHKIYTLAPARPPTRLHSRRCAGAQLFGKIAAALTDRPV